ncbi:MAG: hypothetical protein ACP5OO_03820 [Chloroflexia bacterium]
MRFSPWGAIALGFVLVVLGWLGPFLMVIKVIPASFWLSFLSYGLSVLGLFLGIAGASLYAIGRRRR